MIDWWLVALAVAIFFCILRFFALGEIVYDSSGDGIRDIKINPSKYNKLKGYGVAVMVLTTILVVRVLITT